VTNGHAFLARARIRPPPRRAYSPGDQLATQASSSPRGIVARDGHLSISAGRSAERGRSGSFLAGGDQRHASDRAIFAGAGERAEQRRALPGGTDDERRGLSELVEKLGPSERATPPIGVPGIARGAMRTPQISTPPASRA